MIRSSRLSRAELALVEQEGQEAWHEYLLLSEDQQKAAMEQFILSCARHGLLPPFEGSPWDLPEEQRIALAQIARGLASCPPGRASIPVVADWKRAVLELAQN